MKKRITLKDIASTFGVSIATVSKALNDSFDISTKTKEKIQEYAKANHYKPNVAALNLLSKKTKTIGVIIPNIMNSFFAKVFVGIEKIASQNGYQLVSCISNESHEKEVKTIQLLKHGDLDGLIISLAEETEIKQDFNHLNNTLNEGVPIVMFDRISENINCDKVIVNDLESAFHATDYLLKTGCKRIALISVIDNLSVGKLRVEGYKKALIKYGLPIEEQLIVRLGHYEDFDTAMKIVLSDQSIDGLLCLEESSAINALKLLKQMEYKIPEEMSIICFTNGKLLQHLSPSITAISQHGKYIGETTARILIDRIENEKSNTSFSTKIIKTTLIERESTRLIPLQKEA